MRDLKSNIDAVTGLASADNTDTEVTGATVDLQGFDAVAFVVEVGTITGAGTVTPKLEESDDGSTWSDVASAEVVGEFTALATDTNQKASYNGGKRYVRCSTVVAGVVSAATYGILNIKGCPTSAPVA